MTITSLGFISVRSPGTPVPLAGTPTPATRVYVQGQIGGTGVAYLGVAGMNEGTGAGVIRKFWPTGSGGGIPG
jgi:hypothetical protein